MNLSEVTIIISRVKEINCMNERKSLFELKQP